MTDEYLHPLPRCLDASEPARFSRRALLGAAGSVVLLHALPVSARGGRDEVPVPVGLQAELFVKVAAYDRGFAGRAGNRARVLLVTRPGDDDSRQIAAQMTSALAAIDTIGGLPKEVSEQPFAGAPALAEVCRARRVAIVYFTPGLAEVVPAVAGALDGVDVLSIAAVPAYVPLGVVLGAELVSSKPKLVVNLTQARRQHVTLSPELLKLMKVYK